MKYSVGREVEVVRTGHGLGRQFVGARGLILSVGVIEYRIQFSLNFAFPGDDGIYEATDRQVVAVGGEPSIVIEKMNIQEICAAAQSTAKEKGFSKFETNEADRRLARIALMIGELSEAAEEVRKGTPDIYWKDECELLVNGLPSKPEGLAVELADTVIRICQFCGENNIDLQKAIELKMAFNKTRPHLHGKKFI